MNNCSLLKGQNMKKAEADPVFVVVREPDPFAEENPYLMALMGLPLRQRRAIVRQATLLMAAVDGLCPEDALELLGQVGIWMMEVNAVG